MAEVPEDQNTHYYRDYYRYQGRSQWMERIWSEAFGVQYPAGLEHYGYLTLHDLDLVSAWLDPVPGSVLLDVGCGKGGPGLRLAQEHDLQLIGVDIVAEAVAQAQVFQEQFRLVHPARFVQGHFLELPLEDQSVDAVISIDALWAAHDKIAALREFKRVLRPGGKAIFSYWDLHVQEAIPLFEWSGLKFIRREETLDWRSYQERVYAGIAAHRDELVAEMGPGANMLLFEAEASPPHLDSCVRRFYEMKA